VDLIRDILAAHESGISRDGLLAWARLRGSPQMTDAELDAALAAMGDEVVDVQGFLYLREVAPGTARPTPPSAAVPPTVAGWSSAADVPAPPPDPGWRSAADAPAPPPWSTTPGTAPDGADPETSAWLPADGETLAQPDQPAWTPEPSSGGKRSMLVAAVGVGAFVAVAFAVSFVLRAEDPAATPAVPTPTSGTVIGAESLAVGDCIVLPSEDEFDDVRKLSCTEPHDAEVVFVGDHPDGEFPSDEAFESFVDAQCLPAFEAYTGSEFFGQDTLDLGWFTPTASAWGRGDREIVCHLTPIDGVPLDRSWAGGNP
jgi:hypothetical protein